MADPLVAIERRHQGWERGTTLAASDYRWLVAEIKRLRLIVAGQQSGALDANSRAG